MARKSAARDAEYKDIATQPVPTAGPQVRAVVASTDEAPAIFKRAAPAADVPAAAPADAEPATATTPEPEPTAEPRPEPTAEPAPEAQPVPTSESEAAESEPAEAAPAEATPAEPEPQAEERAPEPATPPLPPIPAAVAAATSAPVETGGPADAPTSPADALRVRGLVKAYGGSDAVYGVDMTVPAGSFYGIVGPNGAGKTTTLSMISGLLKPDEGSIEVFGVDMVRRPRQAKALIGVLPDRVRTFDRLTGRQLLYYFGVLRGLKPSVVAKRTADLARAFDFADALGRVVADYSAGMTKKLMLAGAMIHSPRMLVLDEPFEAVDPVSSASILEILSAYVEHGGTVVLSSHGMDLVESVCSRVAVVVSGNVLAEGTVDEVKGEISLEQRFVELSAGGASMEGLEWLHASSD
ncbi:ATP-binding cassette domain-containing protein [Microbacterium sp. NPDC003461]